jgi:hypothetical protein
MRAAIHQPNFIPWLGYFYKIAHCDVFILLDDVQFSKNSFINRNKIKTSQGEHWLTLPVITSGKSGQLINETILLEKELYIKKNLNSIRLNYTKSPFFEIYFYDFQEILQSAGPLISDLNIQLILWICKCLNIHTPMLKSSELNIDPYLDSTKRLIAICETVNCNSYISGAGAVKYQDEELFSLNQIELTKSRFAPPVYNQLWKDFIPSLSVIDTLFNCGEETSQYIL